jgi:CDGSH-type Zn-finger protein/ferredoxin
VIEPTTEIPVTVAEGSAAEPKKITVTRNGPYMVSGSVALRDHNGQPIQTEETYRLCRCGGSANKPFCDGTHERKKFKGLEVAARGPIAMRRMAFQGKGVVIYDDRSICAHIGNCTDNLPAVFKLGLEPWIEPENSSAEKIADVIKTCPSGALSYALEDIPDPVEEQRPAAITASKNGPYFVTGGVKLESEDGAGYESRMRYTLCRCGGSGNKPLCDGTHWHIGFKASYPPEQVLTEDYGLAPRR